MENQYGQTIIYNTPQFSNTTTVSNASSVSNTVSVTTEVRGWIFEMQGSLNELTDELNEKSEELDAQLKKAADALEKLEKSETKEDIQKSGAMNKLRRFLIECQDPESSTGKLLSGVKYAAEIVKDLAGKYNKIAKWVALPQLPFGDS